MEFGCFLGGCAQNNGLADGGGTGKFVSGYMGFGVDTEPLPIKPQNCIKSNPRETKKLPEMNTNKKIYRIEKAALPTYRMKHNSNCYILTNTNTDQVLCSSLSLEKVYAYCFLNDIPRSQVEQ